MTSFQDLFTEYFHIMNVHRHWAPTAGIERERYFALALSGEAGELANVYKKEWRGDVDDGTRQDKINKELTDVFAYTIMLAVERGYNPIAFITQCISKAREVEGRAEFKELFND